MSQNSLEAKPGRETRSPGSKSIDLLLPIPKKNTLDIGLWM